MRLLAPRGRSAAYFYLSFTACAWGSLYVASKFAMATIPPMTVLFIRFAIAVIALAPAALKARGTAGKGRARAAVFEKADRKYIFLIGFGGYFLAIASLTLGTKLATASVASVINAMNPAFIIFFAALFLKEQLTAGRIFALLSSLSGAYIVLGGARGGELAGVVFSLASVVM